MKIFISDPVHEDNNVMIVEYVRGLGDSLVSGKVIPNYYAICPDGNVTEEIVESGAELSRLHITQLSRTGEKIRSHFGREQDIEWTMNDENLYILQARPITR